MNRSWLVPCALAAFSFSAALAPAETVRMPAGAAPLPWMRPAPRAMVPPAFQVVEPLDARAPVTLPPRLLAHPQGLPLTGPSAGSPEDIALRFVQERLGPAGEIVPLSTAEGPGGLRRVRLEQRFGAERVMLSLIDVAILPDGSVLAARAGELAASAPMPAASLAVQPARVPDAEAARAAALAAFGLPASAAAGPEIIQAGPERVVVADGSSARHAWRVDLAPGGRPEHLARILVDAADGSLIATWPLVMPAIQGLRAWPRDGAQPPAWVTPPDPVLRPSVDSPLGWDTAGETSGNNAHVELDREANFYDDPPATVQASGDPLLLDATVTGDPTVDTDAAVINVFWAINDAHDRFRRLGFDEASGNCQADNMLRGGRGGDAVQGMVQWAAGDGTNAPGFVAMGVGADGGFTYLLASLFRDEGGALHDGGLETDLLYHELTHSASVRLIGGDTGCFNGAQPQAISEGVSDFMAASFTNDPVIGAYTSGRPVRGWREFPVGGGGWSYVNLCEGGCSSTRDGEIVSGILWDLRALLTQRLGAAEGSARAERLALEAMRFAPCRPTFPDLRDAMLVGDTAVFDGANRCTIWQAFAGRGVGASTTTTGPTDQFPVGAYDLPPECSGGASITLDQPEYSLDADAVIDVVTASPPAGGTATVTTSGGDRETIALSLAAPTVLRGVAAIRPGAVVPGDGIVQAATGETLTASHAGAPDDTARLSSAFPIRIDNHHVWGNWCQRQADDDYRDGWYILPGFLDAGENATIVLDLMHDVSVPLEDVRMTVTSLTPSVRVLPATPVELGTLPGRRSLDWQRFDAYFRASAAPTVSPGDTASIRFNFSARGRTGSATLVMKLDMDYELVPAVSAFAGGVETFETTSPTASQWTSQGTLGSLNLWAAEDCAGNGGTRGWRNGNVGCANYSDGQWSTTLLSGPVFPLPAGTAGYRLNAFSVDVDSDLYTDPANGFCDADFVGMFMTTDPASLPYFQPESIYSQAYGACQRYWRPIYEDTGGYVTQSAFSFTTAAQRLTPGYAYDQLRAAFLFWGDVYDCGFESPNSGRFRIDNFALSYDVMREVPETTPCTANCLIATRLEIDPPGPKCADEPFTMRVIVESSNCAGVIHHSFSGPGVPAASGWTTDTEAPALGSPDAYYAVYSECETDTQCADYQAEVIPSSSGPGVGAPWPDSLRAARSGDDVTLTWAGASVPPSYAVLEASTRADLVAGPAAWTNAGGTDVEGPRGEASATLAGAAAAPGVAYYQVFGRDRCTGVPRIP